MLMQITASLDTKGKSVLYSTSRARWVGLLCLISKFPGPRKAERCKHLDAKPRKNLSFIESRLTKLSQHRCGLVLDLYPNRASLRIEAEGQFKSLLSSEPKKKFKNSVSQARYSF